MTTHVSLTGSSEIHVCKGADTATSGQVPTFNGSGGQSAKYANPRGSCYFTNLATPYTLTFPSVYTKVSPTTTASGGNIEVTEGNNARVTYTGTDTIDFTASIEMAVDQSAGATRDIETQIYKNGSAVSGAQTVVTTVSGNKEQISYRFNLSLATNDYIEVYMKNAGASGDINIYSFFLDLLGYRG